MLNRQQIAASTLVSTGMARLSRHRHAGEVCILTFHGLLAPGETAVLLDPSAHTTVELFRQLCAHLAKSYRVLPLDEIAAALVAGRPFSERTVAITFDDGYESNYRLAFPVLREFELPATIFLCTGFIDGAAQPWFLRLENALISTTSSEIYLRIGTTPLWLPIKTRADRAAAFPVLLRAFKRLGQTEVEDHLSKLMTVLETDARGIPGPLRAMSWNNAREMRDSGLIQFGAHTHSHPILGRCSAEAAREEIFTSRNRIIAELRQSPSLFAYPNGLENDYTATTQALVREAGFKAAFTMMPGFAQPGGGEYQVPRYGSPESLHQAEATVSGAFEYFKQWRQKLRRALAA